MEEWFINPHGSSQPLTAWRRLKSSSWRWLQVRIPAFAVSEPWLKKHEIKRYGSESLNSHLQSNPDPALCLPGEHNTEVNEGTEQLIQVAEIIMHEDYVISTADNDIGLLRLASPIVYTPYAVPACLPTRQLAERELWAVSTHTVSGWGRRGENGPTSHILRRLKVPRIRTQQCVEESGVSLTNNMFCAGYIEGRQDSCKGDSGGPLVTEYRKTVFLLGIVSWGKGCARPGNYGIYTRVSNYLEWIHNRTATPSLPTNNTKASLHNLTTWEFVQELINRVPSFYDLLYANSGHFVHS